MQAAEDRGSSSSTSTIQYHGDRDLGGHDACCDFVSPSRCRWKRELAAEVDAAGDAGAGATHQAGAGRGYAEHSASEGDGGQMLHLTPQQHARLGRYAQHDCPVPGLFTAKVSRPLHIMRGGRWAAVL